MSTLSSNLFVIMCQKWGYLSTTTHNTYLRRRSLTELPAGWDTSFKLIQAISKSCAVGVTWICRTGKWRTRNWWTGKW